MVGRTKNSRAKAKTRIHVDNNTAGFLLSSKLWATVEWFLDSLGARPQHSLRKSLKKPVKFISSLAFAVICGLLYSSAADCARKSSGDEGSFSIQMVKTAGSEKKVYQINGRRIYGESYTVKKGDYIYKILKKQGIADRKRLSEILQLLKELNPSLSNLDIIYPGQTIVIPLSIEPLGSPEPDAAEAQQKPSAPTVEPEFIPDPSDIDSNRYTVRRGDTLIKIVKDHHKIDIPRNVLYGKYMDLLKKVNPELKDINKIHPGQIIRLPIYKPRAVRRPIERRIPRPDAETTEGKIKKRALWSELSRIFSEIGEECIQTGAHFIPLPSGGQIDLKAETFPLVAFNHGVRVVVDIHGMLPEQIRKLVETAWDMYRIVNLKHVDTLSGAVEIMLTAAGYPEVRKATKPLRLAADLPLNIHGDWFISTDKIREGKTHRMVAINLEADIATPAEIKEYLRNRGLLLVEFPAPETTQAPNEGSFRTATDPRSLVAELLVLAGLPHSDNVQIPAYQSREAGLKLVIDADFFLQVNDRDAVIDLRGLPSEIVFFLDEHRFKVLELSNVKDGMEMVEKVLEFTATPSGLFPEHCPPGLGAAGSVHASVPGICFERGEKGSVLVIPFSVPSKLEALFSRKNMTVLSLSF